MKNLKRLSELSNKANNKNWMPLYYSFDTDSVYAKPGQNRILVTYLINPNTPQDIKDTVDRWKRM